MVKKKTIYSFKPVTEEKQAHEKIVDQIRTAIFEKRIQPGQKLPAERELAEIFNTSRVTVRAALLTLKNGGLLHVKQGKNGGAFITDDIGEAELAQLLRDIIEWKDISIHHVIEVRSIMEPQLAYMAAQNASDEDIENIWATIRELEQLFATKTKFQSSDENFHRALAAAAKNPLLSIFLASLMDILFSFIYKVVWKKEHKENILLHHRKIAEKVEQRAPEDARKAMVEHLLDMKRILSQLPTTRNLKWFRIS